MTIVDGSLGSDTEYGWGILKAYNAIKRAGGFTGTEPAQRVHTSVPLTLNVGSSSDIVYELRTSGYPVTVTVVIPEVCRSDADTAYGTKPDEFVLEVWDMGFAGTGLWPDLMASDSGSGDRTLVATFDIPWYWSQPYRVHIVVKYTDGTTPKRSPMT